MRGLWGNFWFRTVVVAILAIAVCMVTISAAPYVVRTVLQVLGLPGVDRIYIHPVDFSFEQLFALIPILPFWLMAEPRLWRRRQPFPFGSYLAFTIVFCLVFYACVYASTIVFLDDTSVMLSLLIGGYFGSALLAGSAGYGYYRLWRHRQDRLPPVIPDVF